MRTLQTEIWVLHCPLMIEDKADDTRVTLEFCQQCEYHDNVIDEYEVLCDFPKDDLSGDGNTDE